MTNIAQLAQEGMHQAQQRQESATIRKLFMVLHGAYGNQFIAKFSTGEKDDEGRDKGIRVSMLVWDAALRKFAPDVIEAAAKRLMDEDPKFPPNLPQMEKVCTAITPRKTYAEEVGLPRLPAPEPPPPVHVEIQAHDDGRDWARRIIARSKAGDKIRPYTLWSAEVALGKHGRMSWQ